MAEVIKLRLVDLEQVGDGYRFDLDDILDTVKGCGWDTLVIIGESDDGSVSVISNANAGEALILMERAKHSIVHD